MKYPSLFTQAKRTEFTNERAFEGYIHFPATPNEFPMLSGRNYEIKGLPVILFPIRHNPRCN